LFKEVKWINIACRRKMEISSNVWNPVVSKSPAEMVDETPKSTGMKMF
jgi:hypothetical protein